MEEDRKEKILLKAIELYMVEGYANVSITDLQAALNMGRGTLYYYFKDNNTHNKRRAKRDYNVEHYAPGRILRADMGRRGYREKIIHFAPSLIFRLLREGKLAQSCF